MIHYLVFSKNLKNNKNNDNNDIKNNGNNNIKNNDNNDIKNNNNNDIKNNGNNNVWGLCEAVVGVSVRVRWDIKTLKLRNIDDYLHLNWFL